MGLHRSDKAYTLIIKETPAPRSWQLFVGLALWEQIGKPRYADVMRSGNVLRIAPATNSDEGRYRITVLGGTPRLSMGRHIASEQGLRPGRYDQWQVREGELVVFIR